MNGLKPDDFTKYVLRSVTALRKYLTELQAAVYGVENSKFLTNDKFIVTGAYANGCNLSLHVACQHDTYKGFDYVIQYNIITDNITIRANVQTFEQIVKYH